MYDFLFMMTVHVPSLEAEAKIVKWLCFFLRSKVKLICLFFVLRGSYVSSA